MSTEVAPAAQPLHLPLASRAWSCNHSILYLRHTSAILNPLVQIFARFFEPARIDPVLRRHLPSLR